MTLADAFENIGRRVKYQPRPDAVAEYGKIKRVGPQYVFVKFDGDNGAKSTNPHDLTFECVPCPFCGKFNKLVFDPEEFSIVCAAIAGGCGAMGPRAMLDREFDPDDVDLWDEAATALWNRRTT